MRPALSPSRPELVKLLRAHIKKYGTTPDGQADAANQRITGALGARDTEPEPSGEEDGEGEMAS